MIIPSDIKCKVCPKIFCCSKCREKHELQMHMDVIQLQNQCFLCRGEKSFLFNKNEISINLMNHITQVHLPLHCSKCDKFFDNKYDLAEITKCISNKSKNNETLCVLQESGEKSNYHDDIKISTELKAIIDPASQIEEIGEEHLTPLTKWNLRWRRKSKGSEGSISDSASSLPNISTIHNSNSLAMNKTASPKAKKLVRSTSTPMHLAENGPATKPVIFDSTSNSCSQMSSINVNATNTSEVDHSMSLSNNKSAAIKFRIRSSRVAPSATPLRQLMSRSIQKAMAQQGYTPKPYPDAQRKMSFNSTCSSISTTIGSPLDLRTTPVMRRTQSESNAKQNVRHNMEYHYSTDISSIHIGPNEKDEVIKSDSKQNEETTEIFETCYSRLELTDDCNNISTTPKLTGAVLKKAISFVTPANETKVEECDDTTEDVWHTPSSGLSENYNVVKNASHTILQIHDDSQVQSDSALTDDEVFYSKNEYSDSKKSSSGGRIWNIVTSVIRIASCNSDEPANSVARMPSLVRRAASFAGYIKQYISDQSGEVDSLEQPFKRRRTSSENSNALKSFNLIRSPIAKRRRRIEGRQPIARMHSIH